MDERKDRIEWPSEIRNFIENRLEQAKREETLDRVDKLLMNAPKVKSGTTVKILREDRDSGH
jgi:hypothetical protein